MNRLEAGVTTQDYRDVLADCGLSFALARDNMTILVTGEVDGERLEREPMTDALRSVVMNRLRDHGLRSTGWARQVVLQLAYQNRDRGRFYEEPPTVDCIRTSGGRQLTFWCPYCRVWHFHGTGPEFGSGDGHRVAHCFKDLSPYKPGGYRLREVKTTKGELKQRQNISAEEYRLWRRGAWR